MSNQYTVDIPNILFDTYGNSYFLSNNYTISDSSGNTFNVDLYDSSMVVLSNKTYLYDASNAWYYDPSTNLQKALYTDMGVPIVSPILDNYNSIFYPSPYLMKWDILIRFRWLA